MKVINKIALLTLLLLVILGSPFTLLAQGFREPIVLWLRGYIPPSASFVLSEEELAINTNAHNFTYTLHSWEGTKLVNVVAW